MLYIDCNAGISGSALLGALVDLGIEKNSLLEQIRKATGEKSLALFFKNSFIQNMACTSVILEVPEDKQPISIMKFTDDRIKKNRGDAIVLNGLTKVCRKYAAARSKLLNIPPEAVTEKGSILLHAAVIVAGTFAALEQLNVHRVIASPLPIYLHPPESLADPDPLILELARGVKVRPAQYPNTTNTALGVALLAIVDQYGQTPEMHIDKIGYGTRTGIGKERSAVRVILGTEQETDKPGCGDEETIMVLETSIDDMNPEFFPYIVERLLSLSVLDAFLTPVYMKKGRPANLLTVLCRKETMEHALQVLFRESTTLGVRIREEQRRVLIRKFFKVSTPYGKVSVKSGFFGQSQTLIQLAPEFEDCKQIAMKLNVPIKEVYAAAQLAAFEESKKPGL